MNRLLLCIVALLALSLPAPTLAQETTPTEATPTEAAPTKAAPEPVRNFKLVAAQEYFVALGAQLVSVGALVGAAVLIQMKLEADAAGAPSSGGAAWMVAGYAAPLLAPAASACLLALFEDRPGFKLRSGLRAWLVGMGATFLGEMIGGIAVYVAYQQNDRMRGPIGVIAASIAMVVLPPIFEVVAFEGGRTPHEPQGVSLVPFLTKGGGGVGLAGAF